MNAKITLEETADMPSVSVSSESETTVVPLTGLLSSLTGSFPFDTASLTLVLLETQPPVDGRFFLGPSFPVQDVNHNNSITPTNINKASIQN